MLHKEEQIIDSSRERGRCCIGRGRGLIHQDLITKDNTDSPNKNAIIAFGGSGETFDQLTASPFTPPATWTGAAKVDMSKDGLMNRAQEMAYAKFLENNGMDTGLANIVASGMNGKIKAAKAKKEEKTKAIESTAQTALAVTAMVVTVGGAAPALGSVLTGGASASFYAVQGANIALQAAIGSRTGGVQGAVAGVVNGTLQAVAATNFGKLAEGADKLLDKADEIQTMAINNPLIARTIAATNVSYSKENGWGIKANVSGVVQALGISAGASKVFMERFANVTIGQSQRGGASVNLGFNTGAGTLGLNYTGASGKFDGSFDVMERQAGTGKLSAELNYGENGFSVSGNADLGNGLGFGLESGRNGTTGSLTILGSQQGTVDVDGNYEANGNFLGEISGQDIIDLNNTRQQQREAEENERNPAKNAKDAGDAKDAKDKKDGKDDDAKEEGDGKEGPSGLVDLVFAGTAALVSAGAAFLAGGGSSSASPSAPAGNTANAETPVVGRKPREDELPVGHDNDDPNKGLTRDELSEYDRLQDQLRNGEDLSPEDTARHAQLAEIRNIQVNGNSVADAVNGGKVRDTEAEIKAKRERAEAMSKAIEAGDGKNRIFEQVLNLLSLNGYKTNGEVALSRILEPDSIFTKIKNAIGLGSDISLKVGDTAIVRKPGEKEITVYLLNGEKFTLSGPDDLNRIIKAAGGVEQINSSKSLTDLINKGLSNYEAANKDKLNGGTAKVGDNSNYREGIHYAFELDPQKRAREVLNTDTIFGPQEGKLFSQKRPDGSNYSFYNTGTTEKIEFLDSNGEKIKIKNKKTGQEETLSFKEYLGKIKAGIDSEGISKDLYHSDAVLKNLVRNHIFDLLINELDCGPATKVNALKEAGILRPDMTIYEAEQMFGTDDWEHIRARGEDPKKHPEDGKFLSIALEKSDWGKLNGKYKDKTKFDWTDFGEFQIENSDQKDASLPRIGAKNKISLVNSYLNEGGVIQINGWVNTVPEHQALVIKDNKAFRVNDSYHEGKNNKDKRTSEVFKQMPDSPYGIYSWNSRGITRKK